VKQWISTCLAITISLSMAAFCWIHRGPKMGYVETSVILSEFNGAIQAKKQYEQAQKEWDSNLKRLNDSLNAEMDRMKLAYDKAPESQKKKMREDLRQRNEDLQRYTNAVRSMAEDKEKELMTPVISKVNSFLDQWGKEHSYDIILGTMTGGNILQASPEMNITSRVLKDLNEQYRDLPTDTLSKPAENTPAKVRP